MIMFADDSTLIFNNNNEPDSIESDINENIESVINWLENNNLLINLHKTLIMNFQQRKNFKLTADIKYENKIIHETNDIKFFGLYIENTLKWNKQIDVVCCKLNQYSYALHMLSKVAKRSTVLTAYHGLVASTLRYGIIFWGTQQIKT
jgi:hypothetical protein